MHDVLDPLKNPVTYAVPFFLLTDRRSSSPR